MILFFGIASSIFLMTIVHHGTYPSPGRRRLNFLLNNSGDIGDSGSNKESNSETTQSQAVQNSYTPEQDVFLKSMLSGSEGTTSALINALNTQLNSAVTGVPTDAEKALTLQEKQGVAGAYNDAATKSTEALAGKGLYDSGIANKVMAQLNNDQNKAYQTADVNSAARQQQALMDAITKALGLTSLASGLSTAARGQTGTGASTTQGDEWSNDWGLKLKL